MDKKRTIILEILLFTILLFVLLVSNINLRIILCIMLPLYTILTIFLLKKRKILSIYNKQASLILTGFALVYILIFYILGLYFGYYKNIFSLSIHTLLYYILPLISIIISSELLRYIFNSQKFKYSKVICFILMVLIDFIIYGQYYDLSIMEDFLTVIGFILFSSISCNLLFQYISVRYGIWPIIIYRLITILYVYIITILPDIYIFFQTLIRMIYPYFIYLTLERIYVKPMKHIRYSDKRKRIISISFLILFSTMIAAIVSCKFTYGAIVIGSSSMSGAIDYGDAIIFKQYENQTIEKRDIIIFIKDNKRIVHRVLDIQIVNNQYRYYTKGDVNPKIDDGYVTTDDIEGIVLFRMKYLGYPSLWLKDIFM